MNSPLPFKYQPAIAGFGDQQAFIFLSQVLAGVLLLVLLLTLFIHLRLYATDSEVFKKKEVVVTSIQLTEGAFI